MLYPILVFPIVNHEISNVLNRFFQSDKIFRPFQVEAVEVSVEVAVYLEEEGDLHNLAEVEADLVINPVLGEEEQPGDGHLQEDVVGVAIITITITIDNFIETVKLLQNYPCEVVNKI